MCELYSIALAHAESKIPSLFTDLFPRLFDEVVQNFVSVNP